MGGWARSLVKESRSLVLEGSHGATASRNKNPIKLARMRKTPKASAMRPHPDRILGPVVLATIKSLLGAYGLFHRRGIRRLEDGHGQTVGVDHASCRFANLFPRDLPHPIQIAQHLFVPETEHVIMGVTGRPRHAGLQVDQ